MKKLRIKITREPLESAALKFISTIQIFDAQSDQFLAKMFLYQDQEEFACNLVNFLLLYHYNWDCSLEEEIITLKRFVDEQNRVRPNDMEG